MKILHVLDHAPPLQSGHVSRSLGIIRHQRARGWLTHHLVAPRQLQGETTVDHGGLTFHHTPAPTGRTAHLPVAPTTSRDPARRKGASLPSRSARRSTSSTRIRPR